MGLLFSFFAFFSCNHRCIEAMDDARGLKRDTALTYLWRYTDSLVSSVDSGYFNFKSNGELEFSNSLKRLNQGGQLIWSSSNGSYTYVGCMDNGSATYSTYKYSIKGDSLYMTHSSGEVMKPRIRISKCIP